MKTENNVFHLSAIPEIDDMLTQTIRQGAKQLLATAIEQEVNDYLQSHSQIQDDEGRRLVVRNGYLPQRKIQTGIGDVEVKVPRVRNNSTESLEFSSKLIPPYLKRTKSMEEFIPWLYLKGVSTGDMEKTLSALLGKDIKGLSAKNIGHLTSAWQQEYESWCKRDLSHLKIVYLWADGVYLRTRMDDKQCLLVIIGADESGKKHLLAIDSGLRESTLSWRDVLLNLKGRGLNADIKLAVGDGSMGFWSALSEIMPRTTQQRCWVHKTANVLNKLPKSHQSSAKDRLHQIWMADTREKALKAFDEFIDVYDAKYPKATQCLVKDKEALLSFYDFPDKHWHHLRTTNPIESLFATVKLRTAKTRGCLSRKTGLSMVFKLATVAETKWPRLRGSALMADVIRGVVFENGLKQSTNKQELESAA